MNTHLKLLTALTTLSLALAACGDLPLPGGTGTPGTSTPGTSTGGTSTPGTSTGGTSTPAPTPTPTLSITGKRIQASGLTYYGGGPITLTVQNTPANTSVSWTASQGDLADTGNGSATFGYTPANRLTLDGASDTLVTATLNGPDGTRTLTQTLRVDDQAPLARGGVSVTAGGKTFYLGSAGTFLPAGATFNVAYEDAGVGLARVTLSALRGGTPVLDNLKSSSQLSEASGYTLMASPIADLLGNQISGDAVLGGSFATDFTPPAIQADRAQGAALQPPAGTSTGGSSTGGTSSDPQNAPLRAQGQSAPDALSITASDPQLADGTPGSGLARLTVQPAGTISGNTVTVTWQQLRDAGVTASSSVVTVTATDAAGNSSSLAQRVTLPTP